MAPPSAFVIVAPACFPHPTAAATTPRATATSPRPDQQRQTAAHRRATAPAQQAFNDGPNVAFWRDYSVFDEPINPDAPLALLRAALARLWDVLRRLPGMPGAERAFWLNGLRRTAFFHVLRVLQYNSGLLLFRRAGTDPTAMDLVRPNFASALVLSLHVLEQDAANIAAGVYPHPWLQDARRGRRTGELSGVHAARMLAVAARRKAVTFDRYARADIQRPTWIAGPMYPDYYARTFHFQLDGWMSAESADFYDFETEDFFSGLQDAMQRTTLLPLAAVASRWREQVRLAGQDGAVTPPPPPPPPPPHIVEVACGTGRFATFMRDAFPEARYTISDASPFYLARAARQMGWWEEQYREQLERSQRAGADAGAAELGSVRFVQALAEALPQRDGDADMLVAQYVFHELPPDVRRAVVREAARVVRPGGVFVLTDSAQLGDQKVLVHSAELFKKMDEPYYASFLKEDFEEMICGDGLFVPDMREVRMATKMMSFVRTETAVKAVKKGDVS